MTSVDVDVRWTRICGVGDVPLDEARRWDQDGRTLAVFHAADGAYYVTENVCTHEHAFLSEGYLEDHVIECPRHSGRFDIRTGEALGAPVCVDLRTYPVRVQADGVFAGLPPRP